MTLDELLEYLQNLINDNVTQKDIADALGVSKQAISNKRDNNYIFKEFEIKKITNYIVTKKGKQKSIDTDDCVSIPVRGNLSASLGQGIEIIDENKTGAYLVSRKLMRDVGANLQNTDFVPCEGDSMFPTIEGGALLMVDRSKKEIFDGKIYCVRLNNNLIAKRLQFIPPCSVKVISDNKEKYDPFYVDLSKTLDFDFEIIGQVKWYGTIVR